MLKHIPIMTVKFICKNFFANAPAMPRGPPVMTTTSSGVPIKWMFFFHEANCQKKLKSILRSPLTCVFWWVIPQVSCKNFPNNLKLQWQKWYPVKQIPHWLQFSSNPTAWCLWNLFMLFSTFELIRLCLLCWGNGHCIMVHCKSDRGALENNTLGHRDSYVVPFLYKKHANLITFSPEVRRFF